MAVIKTLDPRQHDLGGGFLVRRLLPAPAHPSIGPFVFFDHFGPVEVRPEDNFDVRPHPHIGLATVTYLFEGAIVHRDSLGHTQRIEPGAINWMTAGRGIVHSERRPEDLRGRIHVNHGLQLWAALPVRHEEDEPAFFHIPADRIASLDLPGAHVRVLLGSAFGVTPEMRTLSDTLYVDVAASPGGIVDLEASPLERAVYSVDRALEIDGTPVPSGTLAVLAPAAAARVRAPEGARFVIVGGAPLDGHRTIWWNFVSSRPERIEQAKRDWTAQRMGEVAGDPERIPLPSR